MRERAARLRPRRPDGKAGRTRRNRPGVRHEKRQRLEEMNCEKCQELLSEFLDGSLGHREHASVSAHLAACPACDAAREDFNAIIGAAREARAHLYAPPDERALWTRVRSAVESEGRVAAAAAGAAREGFWR